MAEKKLYFRSVLEAASNAERIRDENGCTGVDVKPTPDGRAVLILNVPDEKEEKQP
ncbi:MAG: hypothetical protein IJ174_00315 [Clostridia bacterium]|nr:hypothetical protein [Clostridia bacterium]